MIIKLNIKNSTTSIEYISLNFNSLSIFCLVNYIREIIISINFLFNDLEYYYMTYIITMQKNKVKFVPMRKQYSDAPKTIVMPSHAEKDFEDKEPVLKERNAKEYIMEKTAGYFIVPPDKYDDLRSGDHIRYVNTDGNFRTGGFIWYKKTNESTGRVFFMIGSRKNMEMNNPNITHFALYLDKISVLWKKTDLETDLLRKSIDDKRAYISDMAEFLALKYRDEFINFMKIRAQNRKNNQNKTT